MKTNLHRLLAYACAAFLVLPSVASLAQESTVAHSMTLTLQSADVLEDGTVVATSLVTGELRGIVTLQMRPTGEGGFRGEWAFTVAHADHTDPETGIEPVPETPGGEPDPDHPHRDFYRVIHQGAMSGSIPEAQVTMDGENTLTSVTATLVIDQGSLEFEGKTGTGEATLGALTLSF